MVILLTLVHVLVCFFLVVVVLLQSGKAADLAGAFGGMGSQTAFGPRGSATVLSKATTVAAGLFMLTSLTLAIMATGGSGSGSSILGNQGSQAGETAPPAGTPPATPPAGAPAPTGAQPSVELTDPSTGETRDIPLKLPPPQGNAAEQPASKQ